jgi:hypothetical protein
MHAIHNTCHQTLGSVKMIIAGSSIEKEIGRK